MGKKSQLFELSFFVYLALVLVRTFVDNPILNYALIALSVVAFIYEIAFLTFIRTKEYMSFFRTLAMAFVYVSLVGIILIAIFVGVTFVANGANVATLLSISQLCDFYDFPQLMAIPYGNLLFAIVFVAYIIIYYVVTKKIDHRITF